MSWDFFTRWPCSAERPSIITEDNGTGTPPERSLIESVRVLKVMLAGDRLGTGQRADLEYVQEAIENALNGSSQFEGVRVDAEEYTLKTIADTFELDPSTQGYLMSFSHRTEKRRRMKDVGNAVRMGIRMKQQQKGQNVLARSITAGSGDCPQSENLDSWNDFDIFAVARETDNHALQFVAYAILQMRGMIDSFQLQTKKLKAFLIQIEERYIMSNPYHNATHGADVMQSSHVLCNGIDQKLTHLEVLSVLLASLAHDVGHPGVTNDYRVKASDEDAITYSDRSVNENMHCAIMYRTMQQKECDFLRDSLSPKQRDSLRKMVVEGILATDMACHFSKLNALKALVEERGQDITKWESSMPALEAIVHASDLSNVTKPAHLALQWTDRVLTEFFAQGDQERKSGWEISPLCDRKSVSKPGSQVGFMNFIVNPMFMAVSMIIDASVPLHNLQSNLSYWSDQLAIEKAAKAGAP